MKEFNEFQTPLTESLIESLPKEVVDEFWEYVNTVPFIQRLVSPNRKRAKDLPRDEEGKIIVDLSNPHILEDMDYFRETAIHYQKHKCFTKLRVNTHPQSEYMKWFKREIWRIWHGMVRESDGEWITGDMYFYLNYFPIIQTKIIKKGKARYGERMVDLPEVWEGVYWRFHYWEQAKRGGLYNDFEGNQHAVEIARRGSSKSYSVGSKVVKNFVLGIDEHTNSKVKSLVAAYNKEYLVKDGTLNKVIDGINFLASNTQFPSRKIKNSLSEMQWVAGWTDEDNLPKGSENEILGISISDDPDKIRGKRPHPLYCDVLTPDGYKKWGDIQIGDYIYGDDGKPTKVIDIPFEGEDDIYKITLRDGRVTYAGKDHQFLISRYFGNSRNRIRIEELKNPLEIKALKEANKNKVISIPKNEGADFKEQSLFIDPYVMGLYLGDGCYSQSHMGYLHLTMALEDIEELEKYIPYRLEKSTYREISHRVHIVENDSSTVNMSRAILTMYGLQEKSSPNKFIPKEYLFNSRENRIKLLKGLMDSDGTICVQGISEYCTKSEKLKDDFVFLCRSLGINCSVYLKTFHREDNVYYRVKLHVKRDDIFNLPRKKARCKTASSKYGDSFDLRTTIDSVEYVGRQPCKCVTVDNKSHLYLIDDFITTHNSNNVFYEEYAAFPKFLDTWQVALPNVQEGSIAFGQNIGIATGGSEGSDFMGALEMIQYPRGYNVYALPNVYDKNSSGKRETLFFFPGYVNVKGFYNKDGVSDVVGAMIDELKFRYNLKYNSSDPVQLSRRKAETAFTIQDAIMKTDSTIYPVADLNDQINWLDNNPTETQKLYVGKLILRDGEVEWRPDPEAKPINNFPHKDNKLKGAVVIKEHPIKGSDGKVPWGRYISGADTIDTDGAETLSLFSCYVLDLWTDEIVAEYTGREELTDDSFEIYRLLLMYYNAEGNYENNKKGLFSHFSKFNSLHLLADTLEFLREKDPQRQRIGNATKGTPSSVPIKNMGRRMIRDFLLKPYDNIKIEVVDGVETEVKTTERSLKKIRFRALLQELATHNMDGNFDRHDALVMLMLIREDKLRLLGDDSWENRYERDKDYLGDDPFFNSNYRGEDDNKQFLETMKRLGMSV